MILDSKEIQTQHAIELEQALIPLFDYMTKPELIDFEDDIIIFEIQLMKKINMVTTVGWALFNQLPLVQQKNEGTFVQLFPIINCYLYYGREIFVANLNLLGNLVSMCRICLYSKYQGRNNEATNAEAALILQQILNTFTGQIDFLLEEILSMTISRIMSETNYSFFRIRLLGVIQSAFSYNCQSTFNILCSAFIMPGQTYLLLVIDLMLAQSNLFVNQHDKKIAALGLTTLLSQESIPESISHKSADIFKALICILTPDKSQNPLLQKEDMMVIEMLKSANIDEVEGLETGKKSFKNVDTEEMEATLAIATYIDPLQDFDEYDHFREFLKNIGSSRSFSVFTSHLSKEDLERLSNIIQFSRVKIYGFSSSKTEVRRVVKAKKKRIN